MQEIDQGATGWLYKTARKNAWRVAAWMELDDLIQEGFLCYAIVKNKYPHVTEPAHIMSLFQITYINQIHDIAKARTRQVDVAVGSLLNVNDTETAFFDRLSLFEEECASLQTLISQATPAVKAVINIVASEAGRKKLRSAYRVYKGGMRETMNERLCRLTGYDSNLIDLVGETKLHFSEAA